MASTATSDSHQPTSPLEETSPNATQISSFPHRTTNAAPVKPFIDTSTPAINSAPVELDGTPTSPQEQELKRRMSRTGTGDFAGRTGNAGDGSNGAFSPEEVLEELDGTRGVGTIEREKRAEMLRQRAADPGVIVDLPQDPGAEELEAVAGGVGDVHTPVAAEKPIEAEGSKEVAAASS